MARKVSIGQQDFEEIITNGYLYIDKTSFIREWWEEGDSVTLIAPPPEVREDAEHEYVGAFLLREVRRTGQSL